MTTRALAKKYIFEKKPRIAKVWWNYYRKSAEEEEGFNRWYDMTNKEVINDFLDFYKAMKTTGALD